MILRVLAQALITSSLVLFAGAAFAGDCNTDLNSDGKTNEADVAIVVEAGGELPRFDRRRKA